MAISLPPYPITNIEWNDEIMIVAFGNGERIKFIGVKETQYNYIVSANDQRKKLKRLLPIIPHVNL